MNEIIEFSKEHGGLFGFLAVVLALWFGLQQSRRNRVTDSAKELCDAEFRNEILRKRNETVGTAYFAALKWLNLRADRFYGDGLLTLRAFERCLLLAMLYTIIGVFLAWVAFDLHSPGGLALFQPDPSLLDRVWKAGLLVFALGALVYTYAKIDRIEERVNAFLTNWLETLTIPTGFLSKAVGVVSWLVSIGVFTGVVAVVFAGVGVGVVVGVVAVVFAGVGVGVVVGVVAAVSIGVGVGVGNIEAAAAIAFFYLFLPFANAFADLSSVAMTRRFLRWAADRKPGVVAVFVAFVFDAIWGLICLLGLLYLLTLGLDLWQSLSPATVPLDWRIYWAGVRADPRQGLALWLMALTTLLPTLIHVAVGLTAMLTHASRRRVEALDELEQVCGTDTFTEARQRAIAAKLVNADTYAMILGGAFLLIAIYALWQVSEVLLPHLSNWHLLFPS